MEAQLFYMGTSKILEIRKGGSTTFTWGSYGPWTKLKKPVASKTKAVKYSKSAKDKPGSASEFKAGGVTVCDTSIPATAQRTIDGVERTCRVRYQVRGYTIYSKTSALKKKKKMKRSTYTTKKPYQYRLQYEDKAVVDKEYSTYVDSEAIFFFADHYFDGSGNRANAPSHLPHPCECSLTYSDVRRNFESSANNSDGRDNSGSYVLSNVRANVVTLTLKWAGVTAEEGEAILQILNPSKNTKGEYNYITVQYLDPATGKPKNGTFFASNERSIVKYPNGLFKEISVSLMEV